MMKHLTIYVPKSDTSIRPASGVVGEFRAMMGESGLTGHLVSLYFQELTDSIRTFEHQLFHAAGRLMHNYPHGYPTIARLILSANHLFEIGKYSFSEDWRFRRIYINGPVQLEQLKLWAPHAVLPWTCCRCQQSMIFTEPRYKFNGDDMLCTGCFQHPDIQRYLELRQLPTRFD